MRALEEARYGPEGLLNLRDSMPSEAEAATRAENWLRERQVLGIAEAVVITGRGSGSPGGVAVVREGVRKVLSSLKRRGVVADFSENGPGSFLVAIAPLKNLFEAARRRRGPRETNAQRAGASGAAGMEGLSAATIAQLRRLAELSLLSLGVAADERFLEGEMRRQFSLLASSISGSVNSSHVLAEAIQRAIAEYENA